MSDVSLAVLKRELEPVKYPERTTQLVFKNGFLEDVSKNPRLDASVEEISNAVRNLEIDQKELEKMKEQIQSITKEIYEPIEDIEKKIEAGLNDLTEGLKLWKTSNFHQDYNDEFTKKHVSQLSPDSIFQSGELEKYMKSKFEILRNNYEEARKLFQRVTHKLAEENSQHVPKVIDHNSSVVVKAMPRELNVETAAHAIESPKSDTIFDFTAVGETAFAGLQNYQRVTPPNPSSSQSTKDQRSSEREDPHLQNVEKQKETCSRPNQVDRANATIGTALPEAKEIPKPKNVEGGCVTINIAAVAVTDAKSFLPEDAVSSAAKSDESKKPAPKLRQSVKTGSITAATILRQHPKATRTIGKNSAKKALKERKQCPRPRCDAVGHGAEKSREKRSCKVCSVVCLESTMTNWGWSHAAPNPNTLGNCAYKILHDYAANSDPKHQNTYWCPLCLYENYMTKPDLRSDVLRIIAGIEGSKEISSEIRANVGELHKKLSDSRCFRQTNKCGNDRHAQIYNNGVCRCETERIWRDCSSCYAKEHWPYAGLEQQKKQSSGGTKKSKKGAQNQKIQRSIPP